MRWLFQNVESQRINFKSGDTGKHNVFYAV